MMSLSVEANGMLGLMSTGNVARGIPDTILSVLDVRIDGEMLKTTEVGVVSLNVAFVD